MRDCTTAQALPGAQSLPQHAFCLPAILASAWLSPDPCSACATLCLAADKLRTDLSSTQAEREAARAAQAAAEEQLAVESEALRLKLGGMKQHMAKTAAELERERETAAAMKDRVNKLNTNFIQTSDQLRSTTTELSSKLQREAAARAAAEAESEEARLSLGGTKQQMAKTAAQLEREREVAQEMKTRVKALNETYMNSGGWPGCVLSSA